MICTNSATITASASAANAATAPNRRLRPPQAAIRSEASTVTTPTGATISSVSSAPWAP